MALNVEGIEMKQNWSQPPINFRTRSTVPEKGCGLSSQLVVEQDAAMYRSEKLLMDKTTVKWNCIGANQVQVICQEQAALNFRFDLVWHHPSDSRFKKWNEIASWHVFTCLCCFCWRFELTFWTWWASTYFVIEKLPCRAWVWFGCVNSR